MDPMRVTLRGVTKTFGAVRALVGVNASFRSGTVSFVMGPNGSGKSTLMSIVGTLAKPTLGLVDHGSLGPERSAVRAAMGWLGHESFCYGDLTARENLRFASKLFGLDSAAAFAIADDRFRLGAFADRPFRTLSRGQRQRVALARALLHSPRLLLLDEPTAGLDRTSMQRLVEVTREEARRGAVVVVVTHDGSFAADVGGGHLELERGRVLASSLEEA